MNLLTLLAICFATTSAASTQNRFSLENYPNVVDGAKVARTLVNRESLMNVNTIQKHADGKDTPVSFMEYYADCDSDGNPYWLVLDIGSPARNIARGSPYSFSIRAGDHPEGDHVNERYPGGIPSSPAGSPRIVLHGEIVDVPKDSSTDFARLEKCFVERHPDAKWWLPSYEDSPHNAHWVKIMVDEVFMIGGFGDRAYIGPIDAEHYHAASILN